ncbi:hypothetical protein [uncultured Roseovarius sp.]|uniref:hypothetical protein n=1 Tax=uncultured Roseovarius sp. TaxID=293344 RepID=UPI002624B212|nr:hypothetical protein [uncultured Roseovarius sp.]
MKPFTLTLAAALIATLPLQAQETEESDGFSLMEEGAKLFFRGIMEEMEPALDDLQGLADEMQPALRDFVDQMGPALADLLGKVDDLNAYHPPEMLPNGDIILRRKTPLEQAEEPQGEIEL